ncbi:HGGxSTG domain-containing protein [Phenylobacterium sp.]|uniref:HGGxSTG domain-containing protein n=1 Tax=Phenylobacterium sp. TaxID=1871053 RepID=UPI00345BA40B
MQPERLAQAPRCLARTRSGGQCQAPKVRDKARCRMHGGTNPGPPAGNRNALRHGFYAGSLQSLRRQLARLLQGR